MRLLALAALTSTAWAVPPSLHPVSSFACGNSERSRYLGDMRYAASRGPMREILSHFILHPLSRSTVHEETCDFICTRFTPTMDAYEVYFASEGLRFLPIWCNFAELIEVELGALALRDFRRSAVSIVMSVMKDPRLASEKELLQASLLTATLSNLDEALTANGINPANFAPRAALDWHEMVQKALNSTDPMTGHLPPSEFPARADGSVEDLLATPQHTLVRSSLLWYILASSTQRLTASQVKPIADDIRSKFVAFLDFHDFGFAGFRGNETSESSSLSASFVTAVIVKSYYTFARVESGIAMRLGEGSWKSVMSPAHPPPEIVSGLEYLINMLPNGTRGIDSTTIILALETAERAGAFSVSHLRHVGSTENITSFEIETGPLLGVLPEYVPTSLKLDGTTLPSVSKEKEAGCLIHRIDMNATEAANIESSLAGALTFDVVTPLFETVPRPIDSQADEMENEFLTHVKRPLPMLEVTSLPVSISPMIGTDARAYPLVGMARVWATHPKAFAGLSNLDDSFEDEEDDDGDEATSYIFYEYIRGRGGGMSSFVGPLREIRANESPILAIQLSAIDFRSDIPVWPQQTSILAELRDPPPGLPASMQRGGSFWALRQPMGHFSVTVALKSSIIALYPTLVDPKPLPPMSGTFGAGAFFAGQLTVTAYESLPNITVSHDEGVTTTTDAVSPALRRLKLPTVQSEARWYPRPLLEHKFADPPAIAPTWLAFLFSGVIVAFPPITLMVVWYNLDGNLGAFPSPRKAGWMATWIQVVFQVSLISLAASFVVYWWRLNIFQLLAGALPTAVFTVGSGHVALCQLRQSRLASLQTSSNCVSDAKPATNRADSRDSSRK